MSSINIQPHLNMLLSVFLRSKHYCYTGCWASSLSEFSNRLYRDIIGVYLKLNLIVKIYKFKIFLQVVLAVIDYSPYSICFAGNSEWRKKITSNVFVKTAIIKKKCNLIGHGNWLGLVSESSYQLVWFLLDNFFKVLFSQWLFSWSVQLQSHCC